MSKKMTLKEMEPIAREATRNALRGKGISEELWKQIALGSGYEGDYGIFELYVPAPVPHQGKKVSTARVHRETGQVTVETFV